MKAYNMTWHAPLASILAMTLTVGSTVSSPAFAKPTRATKVVRSASKPVVHKAAPERPAPGTYRPSTEVAMSRGRGQLLNLPTPITDVFVSNDSVADVQVKSPTQLYIFAKGAGETSIYATSASGQVVYSSNIRVGDNLTQIDQMLKLAMPNAEIQSTTMNGLVLLTGTVKSPEDSAEAERLVQAFVGDQTKVISRLRTATPLQVNLQVKIAEVSRTLLKEFGTNLTTRDSTNGMLFGVAQGRNIGSIGPLDLSSYPKLDASSLYGLPAGSLSLPFDTKTGQFITGGTKYDFSNLAQGAGKTNLALAGKLFGLDAMAALDLAESEGLLTTLAQPNLTALSGETASFLAGGEVPIPTSQGLGQVGVEFKQYGVSLAFTPIVLDNGRISIRVRPEVSELTTDGAVRLNGYAVPSVNTRRAETTVELGSGQSFMIAGLMRNSQTGSVDRTPGVGNIPVLGAMFRSQSFRNNQTELVIIVTPYLVQPVNANEIALPTDGYRSSTDVERILLGKLDSGRSGEKRPVPTMQTNAPVGPSLQGAEALPPAQPRRKKDRNTSAALPGFGTN
jgi:pilus assembly protein CpaC